MPEIGAYEAKTHLSKLIDRVRKGERFVITRHGTPVAALVPVGRTSADEIRTAIEELKAFREAHRIDGLTLDEMRRDGRRY